MQNEPDGHEKGVRFGCGALLGIPVGLSVARRSFADAGTTEVVLVVLGCMLVAALCAMTGGDKFWEDFLKRRGRG